MNFCSNCGAPATGTAYCGNCGKPLTAETTAATGAGAAGAAATGTGTAGPTAGQPGGPQPGTQSVAAEPARANPFADIPVLDYVRDVVALILLLVSFGMPWDLSDSTTDKIYVVLVTLLSIVSLSLPYLKRGGVLPLSWGTAELRLARLAANAPYVVVVLITLVLGYVGENDGDGIGVGVAFGLAGALLAAQGRRAEQTPADGGDGVLWRWIALGIGAVFALVTVISLIIFLTDDAEAFDWEQVTFFVVVMLGMLALAALPLWGAVRGDAGWRDVLIVLGLVALFVNVWQQGADETMRDAWSLSHIGPMLVLVPALGAAIAAPGLASRFPSNAGAAHWVAVATRLFLLAMFAAAVGVVLYVLYMVGIDDGRGVAIVVLVLLLISALAALVGRNALVRAPNQGRAVAVVAASVLILLGIVIASVLGGSDEGFVGESDAVILSVLWWFGVAVIVVLTAPGSVRREFGPVGASQLNLSSVLPGNGPDAAKSKADTGAAGGAGAAAGAAAATAGRERPSADVPASPSVPVDRPAEKPAAEKAAEDATERPAESAEESAARADGAKDVPATEEPTAPAGETEKTPEGAAGAAGAGAVAPGPSEEQVRGGLDAPDEAPAEDKGRSRDAERLGGAESPGPVSGLAVGEPEADDAETRVQPSVEPPTKVDQPAVTESGFDARTALDPNTPLQTLADIAAQEPSLRKYVAANPSTYPELLTWLGQLGDPEVDEALRRRGL
ncbi:zinc ribbon domain-containing protein [Jiangella asiatica]|uniref:Zinc ribbon domain-containing protein n=1 Tax=Jiangella asiatica TaxID=2530372 RepID=A0A4R5CR45_9ACTN|nr:zinc ribbon domain-containing protein [Jiangella asiatica]TDE01311.1 zinc ribbon domain-containing protein [Jiangella asiatica]